jgi:hypothetical protein
MLLENMTLLDGKTARMKYSLSAHNSNYMERSASLDNHSHGKYVSRHTRAPVPRELRAMHASRTLSLLAATTLSLFALVGCHPPMEEDASTEAVTESLGQTEQELTTCGSSCPTGYHPTSYKCNLTSCGNSCYGPGNSNQVICQPNSGTFSACGSSCPSGWTVRSYSCNLSDCGHSCYGPGNSNQVTCAPVCDPRVGTHSQMNFDAVANSEYAYRNGWCSIGTTFPAQCFNGTYYYSQTLGNNHCVRVGSNGTCQDPDALWEVTCKSVVKCTYNCAGQCVKSTCT